jgi:hypothetical protein
MLGKLNEIMNRPGHFVLSQTAWTKISCCWSYRKSLFPPYAPGWRNADSSMWSSRQRPPQILGCKLSIQHWPVYFRLGIGWVCNGSMWLLHPLLLDYLCRVFCKIFWSPRYFLLDSKSSDITTIPSCW